MSQHYKYVWVQNIIFVCEVDNKQNMCFSESRKHEFHMYLQMICGQSNNSHSCGVTAGYAIGTVTQNMRKR